MGRITFPNKPANEPLVIKIYDTINKLTKEFPPELEFYMVHKSPFISLETIDTPYTPYISIVSSSPSLIFIHNLDEISPYIEDESEFLRDVIGKINSKLQESSRRLVNEIGELIFKPIHIFFSTEKENKKIGNNIFFTQNLTSDFINQIIRNSLEKTASFKTSERKEIYQILISFIQDINIRASRSISSKAIKVKETGEKIKIMKRLRSNINLFDEYQAEAVLKDINGIIRIRGLAGSGKTAILLHKVFRIHALNPNFKIGVTFYSRSLYQFFYKFLEDLAEKHNWYINWENVEILHAWGGLSQEGVYSKISKLINEPTISFSKAKRLYGSKAFEGVTNNLLQAIQAKIESGEFEPIYDVFVIDEAQDLPPSFFKLIFLVTKEPKRIIYAYDELQNLNGESLPPPEELFKIDEKSENIIKESFNKEENDIILPTVYRCNRWILTLAHSIGFGIYREGMQVQAFSNPSLWEDIGYKKIRGELSPGKEVILVRDEKSHPPYMDDLFPNWNDVIFFETFETKHEEFEWIAKQIYKLIFEEKISPENITIVFPNPIEANIHFGELSNVLTKYNIRSHLVGISTSPDEMYKEDSVAITHVYRAKGHELFFVFVCGIENAETGRKETDIDLIKGRSFAFTSITRSQGWIYISGTGELAKKVKEEFRKLVDYNFYLDFKYPTKEELKFMRKVYSDYKEFIAKKQEPGSIELVELIKLIGTLPEEKIVDYLNKLSPGKKKTLKSLFEQLQNLNNKVR